MSLHDSMKPREVFSHTADYENSVWACYHLINLQLHKSDSHKTAKPRFTTTRIKQSTQQGCSALNVLLRFHLVTHWGIKKKKYSTRERSENVLKTHLHTHWLKTSTIILHHSSTQFEEQAVKQFDWIAASDNAHRRVRVIGHHCGYDGSLDSIRGNHASVHWLAEYWRKVIHVLERDLTQTQRWYGISIFKIHCTKMLFVSLKFLKCWQF